MCIKKDVYEEMRKMRNDSKVMRGIAIDSTVIFGNAQNIRKQQDYIYKKLQFYKNLTKTMNKKEGI